jgi:hypothetical protein
LASQRKRDLILFAGATSYLTELLFDPDENLTGVSCPYWMTADPMIEPDEFQDGTVAGLWMAEGLSI